MKVSIAALLPFLASIVTGSKTGLIGYGQLWYDPPCAYACRAVIGNAPLECPSLDHSNMDMGGHSHGGSPMAPCIAENDAFLLTLAHCLSTRCEDIPASKLEAYWADQTTGDKSVDAKWTYGAALANVERPEREYIAGETLNYTALISDESYEYQYDFNVHFDWEETVQSTFVIVLISTGVATPVFLSAITYLPFMTTAIARIKPYLIYPSIIRDYNIRPLPYLLGNAPTMGTGLWIAMFVILNIILGAVSYKTFSYPHPWGFTKSTEVLAYVGYRTGHISFALLPLTVLFSSRNNIFLWITNWHFSTFLVLHRWVARLCAIHAIIHSITLLAAYVSLGTYYIDVHKPYWIWGIVGTLCLLLLLLQSLLWFRRASYEVFLILHILLTLFVMVGCWYHIYYWKPYSGIYELWIYMVCAVWFFDRLFRAFRVAKNGIRRATVVELSDEIVRLDISGVRWLSAPGYHAYVYFPTLQPLRAWQNHPFSVNNSALLQKCTPSTRELSHDKDMELNRTAPQITVSQKATGTDSISIYIKKHRGTTSLLTERFGLPVLLEGPYGSPSREILKCDRVLLICGGIGITGLLSWAQAHVNVKLAWSLKESSQPLSKDLETALTGIDDKTVLVGERLDVKALLEQEVEAGWKKVGVVVCGPAGLCDSVRAVVVTLGRTSGVVFELEVDAFSW
ncbi:ferric reductase like transmembrane component-domain-containing protein [Fusarium flagelliforme]|uniref:ferric reductase like transmembrane component-domain-containing protein n=1 Tax=Fusarium flagelliforme TaxID=2675880 RepID=UPI001E8EE964|nr:ferric reductase like transmembrane component-domain-containing protein [Fusarium flagelliforme]KAH7199003.1 ferric reductase like transmembrane component-domain-containing protein [Fusarium flagelliforme]